MYLPFGPENATLRRMPWVTFTIMGLLLLNWLLHLLMPLNIKPLLRAMNYQASHPWLRGDERLETMIQMNHSFLEEIPHVPRPESEEAFARHQAELDYLAEKGLAVLEKTPLRRWAVYTGKPNPLKFPLHMFYHERIYHVILNLLLIMACAPFIEDLWGRIFFPIFFISGGMVSAMGPILAASQPVFLYGATGAACALMGAFAVRFKDIRIKLFSVGWMYSGKDFYTKPLPFISFWFCMELFFAFIMREHFLSLSVTVWSHFLGFIFGAATALVISRFNLELKLYASDFDKLPLEVRLISNVDLQMEHNETDAAFSILKDGHRQFPDNWEITEKYWDLAVRLHREREALEAGKKLMDYLLESHETSQAFFIWLNFRKVVGKEPVKLDRVIPLANQLAAINEKGSATHVLQTTMEFLPEKATTEQVFALVDAAEFTDPKTCAALIQAAEDRFDLGEQERAHLKALGEEIQLRFPDMNEEETEAIEIAPPLADPTMVLESEDPFSPTLIKALKIHKGVPVRNTNLGLVFRMGDRERTLKFDQIRAVTVGAIRNLSGKPFLLIDLLTDDPMTERPRHALLRLHSHEFTPLALSPGAEKPAQAIRDFVNRILLESEAQPLPNRETVTAPKFPTYPSVYDYEMEVYGISEA